MLYEFAITPDTFDAQNYETHRQNEVSIVQLLRGIIENGLIADLHKGKLLDDVNSRLDSLQPSLRDKIKSCLILLNDRNRLVRHPKCLTNPAYNLDWLRLIFESDNQIKFHEIIIGDDLALQENILDSRFTILEDVLDSDLWLKKCRTLALERKEEAYRKEFASVMRHAKTLDIIDTYINPFEEKWVKTIEILSDLMGKRIGERIIGRIRIHTDEDQIANSNKNTNPSFHLEQWKNVLEKIRKKDNHKFEVIYWRVKVGGEPFHDRQIITNQCAIEVPAGLDLPPRQNPGTTNISLLDEDVRIKTLNKFSASIGVYETRNEWQIKVE